MYTLLLIITLIVNQNLFLLIDCFSFRLSPSSSSLSSVDTFTFNASVFNFTQKVDHFTYNSDETFNQRIILSTDHWGKDGSPIFFYTGNEGDIFMFANNTGFIWDIAPQFNAMIVFAEHRYYGTSMPFGGKSFSSNDTIKYLTVDQALQDYAIIVEWIKSSYNAPSSPVISFGGSYAGMLSAWFRMKFPHLIEGAVAASAPVTTFTGIYDCNKFYDQVTQDYRDYSQICVEAIQASWPAIRRLARNKDGINFIHETFNICPDERLTFNVDTFITFITNTLVNLAMIDYPNPATFLYPLPAYPIRETCKYLNNVSFDDESILIQLARALDKVALNYTGTVKCNSLIPNEMDRGWNIQTCTDMLMPICSNGVSHLFERADFDLNQVKNDCKQQFGIIPDEQYAVRTFGGKNIKSASNIIFSNGLRDPWSTGSIIDYVNDAITIIKIPHACHHEDLRHRGKNDPVQLLEARELEVKVIKNWIRAYLARKNII